MTTEEIASNNKFIMGFMGWEETDSEVYSGYMIPPAEISSFTQPFHPHEAKYHSSWNWLMPVVEKIESLAIDNVGEPYFVIMPNQCEVRDGNDVILSTRKTTTKIIMTWLAVVEFIKWYNNK